jgi:hypothetical protein
MNCACGGFLEEDDFDPRIGICDSCGARYTDKEYHILLVSIREERA